MEFPTISFFQHQINSVRNTKSLIYLVLLLRGVTFPVVFPPLKFHYTSSVAIQSSAFLLTSQITYPTLMDSPSFSNPGRRVSRRNTRAGDGRTSQIGSAVGTELEPTITANSRKRKKGTQNDHSIGELSKLIKYFISFL